MNFIYRQLEIFEYYKIAFLRWEFQLEEDNNISLSSKDNFINETSLLLQSDIMQHYVHFGVFINDELIGMASLLQIHKIPKPNRIRDLIGYLTNVYIIKKFRNKKVGSALLEHVQKFAINKDMEIVIVWPSEKSINFYKRLDFQSEGQPLIYKIRED